MLPERAVLVDESLTSGFALFPATAGAPRHDVLSLTGGAIGDGLPMAVGAAVACPDRPVLAVQADGSAMYTLQALWTMAREQLDVTVLLCDNGAYAILAGELENVGAAAGGQRAGRLLDLGSPSLDFVSLAAGMGVPGERATTGPSSPTRCAGRSPSRSAPRGRRPPAPRGLMLLPVRRTGSIGGMPSTLTLAPAPPSEAAEAVRLEVRQFLAEELAAGTFSTHVDTWLSGVDPAFSRKLASAGGWA